MRPGHGICRVQQDRDLAPENPRGLVGFSPGGFPGPGTKPRPGHRRMVSNGHRRSRLRQSRRTCAHRRQRGLPSHRLLSAPPSHVLPTAGRGRPGDATEWEDEVHFGERLTYPTLVCGADNTLGLSARRSFADRPWEVELWERPPGARWQRRRAPAEVAPSGLFPLPGVSRLGTRSPDAPSLLPVPRTVRPPGPTAGCRRWPTW